jgi:hypothetical protein
MWCEFSPPEQDEPVSSLQVLRSSVCMPKSLIFITTIFLSMQLRDDVLFQTDSCYLSVHNLQPVACAQDSTVNDAFSRGGSANSEKEAMPDRDAYVPVIYISPESYALLAAAETSAARRAPNQDAKVAECDESIFGSAWQEFGTVLSMATMAPPKRYYTTFWRSITLRLLDHWARTGRPSSKARSFVGPTGGLNQVAGKTSHGQDLALLI